MTAAHATARLVDWQTALRAENKAPGTVSIYVDGATRYLRCCTEYDYLPMSRAALNAWVAAWLDASAAPVAARIRQLAVRRFASWLAAGGEIPADPFPGVKAPRVEPPLAESLTDDELRALIGTWAVPVAGASPGTRCITAATRPSSAHVRDRDPRRRGRRPPARRPRPHRPADHNPPRERRAGE